MNIVHLFHLILTGNDEILNRFRNKIVSVFLILIDLDIGFIAGMVYNFSDSQNANFIC